MSVRQAVRPGGRSLRVQQAVHAAVGELIAEVGRDALTVPQVAQRAGVTSSTIYRRWGDLATLVSDVARRSLRTDCPIRLTGDFATDLAAWAEMYQDEMDSTPGRNMVRDVLRGWDGTTAACALLEAVRPVVETILTAAGPPVGLSADRVIDAVVAPVLMRLIFADAPLPAGLAREAALRVAAVARTNVPPS
ncbi:TetR/AcrR family transcriptional regulator [Gluconacetobacter tumulicola]|uniref:TetR/AcrR family transcriptional regulator n=1 Tax=Gluconacetobacter tumulicola TaxID=1017177 RepID=A0A7W4JGU6_9PROT|nr:TetR/AcrR family transcriptional regulator [Gluconacetobacter tumulicola]MBB2180966.1 TetR/AcrR family transcriptional regulator [Gluconacetobacter tumulicola]